MRVQCDHCDGLGLHHMDDSTPAPPCPTCDDKGWEERRNRSFDIWVAGLTDKEAAAFDEWFTDIVAERSPGGWVYSSRFETEADQ